jgi:uncharacterized protein YndB with AHSA1/START domain
MTEQTMLSERTIVIEREFDAPRAYVWKAFTDPDEMTKWWGPKHFTTPREKIDLDLRPGGACSITMVGPDGEEYPSVGNYDIVEPPGRLSFSGEIPDNPMLESVRTSVEFVELGPERTKVVVTSRMICAEALVALANAGWSGQFDKLDRLIGG